MAKSEDLNDQQELFCRGYIKHGNATRAWRHAYPESGYAAARSSSCEALTKPNIKQRIEELKEDRLRNSKVMREEVLAELKEMGFSKIDNDDLSPGDRLRAIESLIKMQGFIHEPGRSDDDAEVSMARASEALEKLSGKRGKKSS